MELVEVSLRCPYCGEQIAVMVDPVSGEESYVEDCSVCCRPMVLAIEAGEDDQPVVTARREQE